MDVNSKDKFELEQMRHSLAHILAMALLKIYPNAKLGIGPVIENGFYYEVDANTKIVFKDLLAIEEEMHKIIKEDIPFKQFFIPKEQAFDTLLQSGQIYKSELLQQVPDAQVSFYKTGDFFDLCRGPHLQSTGKVGFFKLTQISTSHWLGQKDRPKLQRIDGVAFETKKELDEYLEVQEELAKRDYHKIGRHLKLISFDDDLGTEFVTWQPKGSLVKEVITDYLFGLLAFHGFDRLETPAISKFTLYRDYFEDEHLKKEYLPVIKAENNQYLLRKNAFYQHCIVYKSLKRSYKNMPVRYCELIDTYFLNPNSNYGEIMQQQIMQTHIFLSAEQVVSELQGIFLLLDQIFQNFSLNNINILARIPDQKLTNPNIEQARKAIEYLQEALASQKRIAKIATNEYCNEGSELVFTTKDIHGETIEIASLRLDMVSGQKEKLTYVNNVNRPDTPVIIQCNLVSSLDNLFKLLLESNLGAFPLWLAPSQVVIIAISEKYNTNAQEVYNILIKEGLRVQMNIKDQPMQAKIRSAEQENIPYMLIIGEKELRTNSVSIRQRNGQELGLVRIEEFIDRVKAEQFPRIA